MNPLQIVIWPTSSSNFESKPNTIRLSPKDWDDFGFKTLFDVVFVKSNFEVVNLGSLKIGFAEQQSGRTVDYLNESFAELDENFFSLGQDVEYYQTARDLLSLEERESLFTALRDVVFSNELLNRFHNSHVFNSSLLRHVSFSVVRGQFKRVIEGRAKLDEFEFTYELIPSKERASFRLDFHVEPRWKLPTNIHVLIGRNGVGKTSLLNSMVETVLEMDSTPKGRFIESLRPVSEPILLEKNYFSNLVSVSFSAFDPFNPPPNQRLENRQIYKFEGVGYFYVGMKNNSIDIDEKGYPPKDETQLLEDFIDALQSCFSQKDKRERWLKAIRILETDINFKDMEFGQLAHLENKDELSDTARYLARYMSSGHKIVLLTITSLVDAVEEKTLVLMDEPESHLHPPLLSAFMRAVSDLLNNRNGVAIIATHSPVVVQEVPSTCVWILSRSGLESRADRPEGETLGENTGVLTREVFGLAVKESGINGLLRDAVDSGDTFENIMYDYNGMLGVEAQGILRVMIAARDLSRSQQ